MNVKLVNTLFALLAICASSCGFNSKGSEKSEVNLVEEAKVEKNVTRQKVTNLSQDQIKAYAKVNSCYLPLVNDSTLYPDKKRSFFSWNELYNDSLKKENPYRNRYIVGDFMVLDEQLQNRGIEEKNPDLLELIDFKKYDKKFVTLMDEAIDSKPNQLVLFDYIRKNHPTDSLELFNFFLKIWQFKTPGINNKFAIINSKAFALGQKVCLCEVEEDTLRLISQFAISSKRLMPSERRDENGKVLSTTYVQNLPLGNGRNYYGAQYLITSKNWETARKYENLDKFHDEKLGGGNNRVTFFKSGAQLPNFLLMTPGKEYPKSMRQNGIHEVALAGLSRGMLGAPNSIGCIRATDFGSKFIRWWVPQNAKFFILYAENRYFSELPMQSLAQYLPFKSEVEGNAFRKWLVDTKPLKAAQLNIDKEGKHDNGHILEAYNLYGKDYEAFKSSKNE